MNRTYSLLILGCLVFGAVFSPTLLSASNVIAYVEDSNEYFEEINNLKEEHEGRDGKGYYDHYESGIYEDKYGKIFYK